MRLKNKQLGELLDRVYTVEGLIQLALSRPDYDEKIQRLMAAGIFDLADKIAEWDSESLLAHREALADARAVTDENSSYSLDEEDKPEENAHTEIDTPEELSGQIEVISPEDIASAEPNSEPKIQKSPLSPEKEELINDIIDEKLAAESIEAETAKAGLAADTVEIAIDEPKPLMATINEPIAPAVPPVPESAPLMATIEVTAPAVEPTQPSLEPAKATAETDKSARPRPVFSINDRYFFTRALFHQSHNEFESCIQAISRMDNYDEAEDYLVAEYDWDLEDSNVTMFLDIIHRYFDALQK